MHREPLLITNLNRYSGRFLAPDGQLDEFLRRPGSNSQLRKFGPFTFIVDAQDRLGGDFAHRKTPADRAAFIEDLDCAFKPASIVEGPYPVASRCIVKAYQSQSLQGRL